MSEALERKMEAEVVMERLKGELRALLILAPIVLLAMLMFGSCEEIKFRISGQQVDANFQGFRKSKGSRGGRSRTVNYSFLSPAGKRIAGSSSVSSHWRPPSGTNNTVKVTYLKNNPSVSEMTETRSAWPIFVMLGLLVFGLPFGLIAAWKFNRNLHEEMSSGKQRR